MQRRKEKLLDLRLDNNIDRDIYDKKNQELSEQLKKLQAEQLQLVELSKNQESTKTRIREFRKNLNSGELLERACGRFLGLNNHSQTTPILKRTHSTQ